MSLIAALPKNEINPSLRTKSRTGPLADEKHRSHPPGAHSRGLATECDELTSFW